MWNLFTNIKAMSVSTGFNQARRFVELREKHTASVLQNLQLRNLQLRNLQLVQRCPLYPPQHPSRCRQHQRHDPAAPVDRRIGLRHHEHRHRPCFTAMVMVTRMGEHHWHASTSSVLAGYVHACDATSSVLLLCCLVAEASRCI